MDNPEEVLNSLEEFSKMKCKDIPRELDDYLCYVAKTGDPLFKWSITKCLFREKLIKVITDFYESTLTIDLPPCPNVEVFNYETMKASLIEKLDSFHGAPFTVQRISELLTNPRKEYNRADKFMRAIEKNILVVSTREPGKISDAECENVPETDTSYNGMPEPNETSIETSFTCNDLAADPDSSSPNFEAVNSEVREPLSPKEHVINCDTETGSQLPVSGKPEESVPDAPVEESVTSDSALIENSNVCDKSNLEEVVSEKESEGVICSTVSIQESECVENSNDETVQNSPICESHDDQENESADSEITEISALPPFVGEEEDKDPGSESELSYSEKMSCEDERVTRSEENNEVNVTESMESEDCPDTGVSSTPETSFNCDENVDIEAKEQTVTDSQSASSVSDDRPIAAECDTSNTCDSDVDVKQFSIESEISISDNEVSSCGTFENQSRTQKNDCTVRTASVIQVTASVDPEAEPMEVSECQISSAEESEVNLEGKQILDFVY